MTTYYQTRHGGYSRLGNSDHTGQTADNGNKTGWVIGDVFILYSQLVVSRTGCDKTGVGGQIKLRFSKDGGAWTDVGAATEISWAADADTSLDDDTTGTSQIATNASGCSGAVDTVYENAADNTVPDSGTTGNTASEAWHEIQWGLDTDNATAGSVYTFQLYNITQGTACTGTIASSLTIASADQTVNMSAGTVASSGQALKVGQTAKMSAGTVASAGRPLTLDTAVTLQMSAGTVVSSGEPLSLAYDQTLPMSAGNVAVAGRPLTVIREEIILMAVGNITVAGKPCDPRAPCLSYDDDFTGADYSAPNATLWSVS